MIVAVYANFYPIAFKTGRGTYSGLDVDIMKLFGKVVGLKIQFEEYDHFDGIWNMPAKKRSDVSIGGIGMTPGRLRKQTEWTMPYFHLMRTVVYNRKTPITKFPEDVKDTVLGTFGSTGWLDAQLRARKVHKDHFMQRGSTDEEDIRAVVKGKVQGIMRGSFVGQSIVAKHKEGLVARIAQGSSHGRTADGLFQGADDVAQKVGLARPGRVRRRLLSQTR